MTNITELQTKLEALTQTLNRNTDVAQAHINVLREEIDALKAGEKAWPQEGSEYYFIYADGDIYKEVYYSRCESHSGRLKQGSFFPTREAAERERDRRVLIVELRKRANGFVPTWNNHEQEKYFISYNWNRWDWSCVKMDDYCPSSGYFAAPIDGLIEEFGDRLNLLRSAP